MQSREEGGLRLKRGRKLSSAGRPLVTVITVTLNAAASLEKTMQSVFSQDYPNLEYIILDGGSSEGTLDLIRKYSDKVDYWRSERDEGLYDAMNRGVALASGEWVNFMNAGDVFSSPHVLSGIFLNNSDTAGRDIIYGNIRFAYEKYPGLSPDSVHPGRPEALWKGTQIFHQSSFSRKELCSRYPFNNSNIAADFEFFYRSWLDGASFHYVDLTISDFQSGGVSERKRYKSLSACFRTVMSSPPNGVPRLGIILYYFSLPIKMAVKDFLKFVLPRKLLLQLMAINNRRRFK